MTTIEVHALFEAHLVVTDLNKAIEFYRDVVGLRLAHVTPGRQSAFFWIGSARDAMLGLWVGGGPQRAVLHTAFRTSLANVLAAPGVLRAAGITPLDFDGRPTNQPVVLAWMPAAAVYFLDPDGNLLEYIAMLPQEAHPEHGIVPWSMWELMCSYAPHPRPRRRPAERRRRSRFPPALRCSRKQPLAGRPDGRGRHHGHLDEHRFRFAYLDVGWKRLELGNDCARRTVLICIPDHRHIRLPLRDSSRNGGHGNRSLTRHGGQTMTSRRLTFVALLTAVMGVAPVSATSYFFSTGNPDGRLASLSQPVALPKLETETADDFILTETTSIRSATITGLITTGAPLSSIDNVEVEIYRVFPNDSLPPSRNVPTRMNSPADVEVEIATRDGRGGTLGFSAAQLNASFAVQNTVVTDINKAPGNVTHGEGSTAEGPSMMSVPIRGQSGFRSELRIHASRSGRNGVPGDAIGRGADSCSTSGGCL